MRGGLDFVKAFGECPGLCEQESVAFVTFYSLIWPMVMLGVTEMLVGMARFALLWLA